MEVYLIRHTIPDIAKGICYGQSDISLSDSYQQEYVSLIKHLPEKIDVIYSSPLVRCTQLAEQLKSDGRVIEDKRLMEMNFGDWEMKNWDAVEQESLNKWMQDFVNVKAPNGENFLELYARVNHFADELVKQEHKTVAIVTHAGVIRSFIAKVLEIPLNNAFKIPVNYASVTRLNIAGDNCFSNIEFLNKV
jgi:alpha-ribazole phosphatase